MDAHSILFCSSTQSRYFRDPVDVIVAVHTGEVMPALRRIEAAVESGVHAAGYVAYEAAAAFDAALVTHPPSELPLLWFGLYRDVAEAPSRAETGAFEVGAWEPLLDADQYADAVTRIRAWIASGDTYQVNYTFPMAGRFRGDALGFFHQLCRAQGAEYSAFVNTGRFQLLSVSPELFFRVEGEKVEMRPMKGTCRRGPYAAVDERAASTLASSPKERAENVMIVDLIRNDLGRIAEFGSVKVHDLFRLERYETVWQMTSSVTARTRASIPELFRALFPSGSVTGAPKVRTMQIIRALEPFPRGVYCGSIGWWSPGLPRRRPGEPGRRAVFNVAIRTVTVDSAAGSAEYHVGGGITWDSVTESEYDECRAKAAVLSHAPPEFELLESLLWDGDYLLLAGHLRRLADSAQYFGFSYDVSALASALACKTKEFTGGAPQKVRLLLAQNGLWRIEAAPAPRSGPVRLGFAREPVEPSDVFLYHKTTRRALYERARASRPDCDDVLLWNTQGEVTESTTANVVVDLDGGLVTPPVACGLLAGVMRADLLAGGKIQEQVLTKRDIARARAVYLVNSVRRWMEAILVDTGA